MTKADKVKKIRALLGLDREVKHLIVETRKGETTMKVGGTPVSHEDIEKLKKTYDINTIHLIYEAPNKPVPLRMDDDSIDVTLNLDA